MPFTDFSDLYGSAHEDGFNRIIRQVMRQRPSLFNYGTPAFVINPDLLCCPPKSIHPEVTKRGNPVVGKLAYLPIPGYTGPFGLEYNFSLAELLLDFAPRSQFTFPPELGTELPAQALAIKATVCGGIACPDPKFLDQVTIYPEPYRPNRQSSTKISVQVPRPPSQGLPFRTVECFRLEAYVVLHVAQESFNGEPVLGIKLDNLELVDVGPQGLENSLECLLKTTLRLGILPQLRVAFNALALQLGDFISIVPTPISATVPFNPAVEADSVIVRLDLQTP